MSSHESRLRESFVKTITNSGKTYLFRFVLNKVDSTYDVIVVNYTQIPRFVMKKEDSGSWIIVSDADTDIEALEPVLHEAILELSPL